MKQFLMLIIKLLWSGKINWNALVIVVLWKRNAKGFITKKNNLTLKII